MKVVNDDENPQASEKTVSRHTLDEWQRKDQARRAEAEGQDKMPPKEQEIRSK
ncbi:hypothetical protein [Bradyrhizobium sp. AUGA SZCCT0160]|uniref:hypothetical protein n=1 Tax=Bradyrhizobium sp. AUGA SZCCT0160 TaxID=2807662 RepID=UPI001BA99B9D|nr:hypothetical protein [Bradyrhizobium sp. AUGA SZCCT0160]MBR1187285.1 hypothetical protein [Bradyrhizobium sp. AUGA SZCCT0160]